MFSTFAIVYATNTLSMSASTVLNAVTLGTVGSLIFVPLAGIISDKVGRKKVFVTGAVMTIVFAIPFFLLFNLKSMFALTLAVMIGFACWSTTNAVIGTMFSELYKPEVRYTGISLGYQTGAALFGGTTPLIATALIAKFNSWLPAALYLMLLGVLALICLSLIKTRSDSEVGRLKMDQSQMDQLAVQEHAEISR